MAIPVSTLLPGLLVHVSTSIKGNVKYDKSDEKVISTDGAEIIEWTTERTILDPKEQKLATEVKSKARNLVVSVCVPTEHGLLCPVAKRADLDAAFDKARALVAEFNASSTVTRLKFNALAGYIAPDDLTAVRAINGEVRDLIADMQAGIEGLDVERVRDAAKRAKKIGNMLTPELQAKIDDAVKSVRSMATKMVEAGEQAATAIDAEVVNKLTAARTAFLDLDNAVAVAEPADASGRALDLAPCAMPDAAPAPAPVPELEIA
jgi:hypothetical protein